MHLLDVTPFQHLEESNLMYHGKYFLMFTAFEDLMENDISYIIVKVICSVILYDRTNDLVQVNDTRKWLFRQRSIARSLKSIPPTQAAFMQHII